MTATAENPVEIAAVGAVSCFYRSDTGALSLLNPAGRDLWERLRHGSEAMIPAEGAEERALATAWRNQGFLGPRSQIDDADELAALRPVLADGYLLDRCFALGPDRACRLTVSEPVLASLLEAVLEPLVSDGTEPAAWIDVLHGDDGLFHIAVDGTERFAGDLARARSEALRHVLLALAGWDRVGALLHATTVLGDGGGVALIGASGSGKSTLAAELIARRYRYVADDLSALDRDVNAVHPFPLGLSVKSGSWDAVGRHFPELSGIVPLVTRRLSVRYLDLSSRAVPQARIVPLAALIFPVFVPSQPLEALRLAPEAALQLAVSTGSEPDGLPRSIEPLARLCNEVPAWHVAYGDAGEAADWILARATQCR